jgi:hypothetical protein
MCNKCRPNSNEARAESLQQSLVRAVRALVVFVVKCATVSSRISAWKTSARPDLLSDDLKKDDIRSRSNPIRMFGSAQRALNLSGPNNRSGRTVPFIHH